MNDFLRNECKYLKVYQGVSYKEIAEYLEMRADCFYNWLNGHYNFGSSRQKKLKEIIELIKEV